MYTHVYTIQIARPEETVDPDQMLQNVVTDKGLHHLLLIQQYFGHINRY